MLATQRLFEAAAAAAGRASSSRPRRRSTATRRLSDAGGCDPAPLSPYGITKLACEHLAYAYASEFGLDVVTVRYFTIYGPRQRPDMAFTKMVSCLAEGRPFDLYGDGSQSRSFTYVDDAVDATIAAMERALRRCDVQRRRRHEVSMLEALETLGRLAGAARGRSTAAPGGRCGAYGGGHDADPRELGWEPTTPFEEGLAAQWRWAAARVARRMSDAPPLDSKSRRSTSPPRGSA